MKALKTNKTPEEFILDVISVIGSEGNLLIPALTYDNVNFKQPHFSVRDIEPCIGLIPKRFFKMDGIERSLHPTHSVCAFEKKAKGLTSKKRYVEVLPNGIDKIKL